MKFKKTLLMFAFLSAVSAGVAYVAAAQDEFDNESILYNVSDADLIAEYFDFAPLSFYDGESEMDNVENNLNRMLLGEAIKIEDENYFDEGAGFDSENPANNLEHFMPLAENFNPVTDTPMEGPLKMRTAFFGGPINNGPIVGPGNMGRDGRKPGGMAGMGMMPDKMGMGIMFLEGMKDKLGLSDDQIKQLRAKRIDLIKATYKARADLQIARLELKGLIEDKDSDISAIKKKMRQVDNLSTDLKIAAMKTLRDARNVLTDEQKSKLDEIRKERPGRGMMMDRMKDRGDARIMRGMQGGKYEM